MSCPGAGAFYARERPGMKAPPGSPAGRGFSFESSPGESFGARLRNSSRTSSSDSIFKQPGQFSCRTVIAIIPHATSSSRREAPETLMNLPPKRGRGERRVPAAPAASCALVVVERTRATTSTPESPGIPARNGFSGLCRALPGDRALLPPSSADMFCLSPVGPTQLRELDASVGASGPHDFSCGVGCEKF